MWTTILDILDTVLDIINFKKDNAIPGIQRTILFADI